MPRPPTVSFRFDPELLAKVDAYAAQLAKAAGVPVSRNAAAAKLIAEGLLAAEGVLVTHTPKPPKGGK